MISIKQKACDVTKFCLPRHGRSPKVFTEHEFDIAGAPAEAQTVKLADLISRQIEAGRGVNAITGRIDLTGEEQKIFLAALRLLKPVAAGTAKIVPKGLAEAAAQEENGDELNQSTN